MLHISADIEVYKMVRKYHADVAEAIKCSLLLKHNIFAEAKNKKWAWRQASL
jgi:hypothetical protein